MHFIADRILVNVVQQVARRDRDHTDVSEVVDHQLQDLTGQMLWAWGFEMGDLGHVRLWVWVALEGVMITRRVRIG